MSELEDPRYEPTRLPYRMAVLCYLWTEDDRLLMLHRRKHPNPGRFSPIGGKMEISEGETPHECARREIHEEAGIEIPDEQIRMTALVAEKAYQDEMHWMLFCFEVTRPIDPSELPRAEFEEGTLEWVPVDEVENLNLPETDREVLWPLLKPRRHRPGFLMVEIDCGGERLEWRVVEDTTAVAGADPA